MMAKPKRGRSTAAIDDHVGARIRERRIMLGLTQQQLADQAVRPNRVVIAPSLVERASVAPPQ